MEIVAAIIFFIIVCAGLMVWDYYKPARFRTTYSNVDKKNRSGDAGPVGWFSSDGDGDGGGGGGD